MKFFFINSYLYKGVSLQLHVEYAGNSDGASNAIETQIGDLGVIAILKPDAECRQERGPTELEDRGEKDYQSPHF